MRPNYLGADNDEHAPVICAIADFPFVLNKR